MEQKQFKKLKVQRDYGEWWYVKISPSQYNDLDSDVYELYGSDKKYVGTFAYYDDMKYYIYSGEKW